MRIVPCPLILVLVLLSPNLAHGQELAAVPPPVAVGKVANTTLDLGGRWRLATGDTQGEIDVPGQWVQQGFAVEEGTEATYTRSFELPQDWAGLGVRLRFDSVFSEARVEINGREVGRHEGGFVAFEFDVTQHVRPGSNDLVVAVKGAGTDTDLLASASQYAVHDLGGITGPVTLYAVPEHGRLERLAMASDVAEDHSRATVRIDLKSDPAAAGQLLGATLSSTDAEVIGTATGSLGPDGSAALVIEIDQPALWTHETPTLHVLRVEMEGAEGATVYERRVGIREITVVGREFRVNHRPVVLRGINRHMVDPYRGRVVSPELARRDAELFRNANINLVRTSHYPPSAAFVQACDELGIMVEVEAPFCWVGKYSGARSNWEEGRWDPTDRARWQSTFERLNLQTVAFHQLSPSVVIWSLANESLWSPLWADVDDLVEAYDPTRPTIFHDPPGVAVDNDAARPDLQNLHYPGPDFPATAAEATAPVFLGEFCHLNSYNRREMLTDPGVRDRWGRGFSRNWERVLETPGVIGGAIWSGIDDYFYLPNGLTVGYGGWGPVDSFRRTKPEHWHIKKTYSPVRLRELSPGVLVIENRHAFTDLADVRVEWSQGERRGVLAAAAPPGGATVVGLPPGVDPALAPVTVRFTDGRGVEVDRFVVTRTPMQGAPSPDTAPATVRVIVDDGYYMVTRGGLELGVHAATGHLDGIRVDGREVLGPGISLMLVPLNGEGGIQLTGDNQIIEPFNPVAGGWTDPDIRLESRDGGGVVIHIGGTYDEASGAFRIGVPEYGPIEIAYGFVMRREINPRDWGVLLTGPARTEMIRWSRRGLWSAYPETHIGRNRGEARLRGIATRRGDWPEHPWSLDDSPLGSNDFRSTKHRVAWAELIDDEGFGVRVVGRGENSSRSWRDGDSVRWLIAGFSNAGNEPFYRPHAAAEDRPLGPGDRITGSFELLPVGPGAR